MAEQHKFKMHEKLLLDVIKKQAGSIQKAVLEGVMNSIEAGATRVDVSIGPSTVSIVDDGRGFRNKDEIDKFFATFGQPHEESEGKVWAQFRMGRGQMFAFGRNTWRTGEFEMRVDVEGKGLHYDLDEGKSHRGCAIEIELYQKLRDRDIYSVVTEVEKFCKYVSVPVVVNDKQVNKDPRQCKWDFETDDAWFRVSQSARTLEVYNLGVYVCDVDAHYHGIGGVVVSKSRLDVNFARNDVTKSHGTWRRIAAALEERAGITRIKRKTSLNDVERASVIERLCAGELDRDYAMRARVLVDVAGNTWSANKLKAFNAWSFAKCGDRRGDALIQAGIAFVLDEENVGLFRCKPEELMQQPWKFHFKGGGTFECALAPYLQYASFVDIAAVLSTDHVVLPPSQWTRNERIWVRVLERAQRDLVPYASRNRAIKIGVSDTADAWTDGRSFIAFRRAFLGGLRLTEMDRPHIKSIIEAVDVLAHEVAHDEDSTTDVHSPEFYKKFHDTVFGQHAGDWHERFEGLHAAVAAVQSMLGGDGFDKLVKQADAEGKRASKKSKPAADADADDAVESAALTRGEG